MPAVFALVSTGAGNTVIVNVLLVPEQLSVLAFILTVIVAVTALMPVFFALNGGILPLPLAANPIDGSLFVHVIDVLGDLLLNGIPPLTNVPLQYD